MTDTTASRPPWIVRIVRADGGSGTAGTAATTGAAGVPVTRLDEAGNAAGYWVSDAEGVVRIPPTDEPLIRVRVGLRNEAPVELTALRLFEGPVDLPAPRDLPVAMATRAERTSGAIQRPVTGGDLAMGGSVSLPGQVLQFARLVVFAPPPVPTAVDQLPLLSSGDVPLRSAAAQAVDFFEAPSETPGELRYGAVVEVEQYWQPLGYATGDLLYSAALAPGDEARVAILDGRWGEGGTPRERPLQTLARLIGSPLLSDLVSESAATWPLDPLTLPSAADLGPALTQGAADTVRYLNERAVKVAETVRRAPFRVGEARGDMPGDAGLRTVKNPRDDRVMTYHFYEPLQRYRVVARAARVRPVVLVPFRLPNLAVRGMVRQYGHVLRRVLLDRTLLPELEALLGLGSGPGADWERAGTTPPVSELRLIVEPGAETAAQLAQLFCYLHADTQRYTVHFFPAEAARGPLAQDHPEANQWIGAIRLADFHQHPLRYPGELALENGSPASALFQLLHVEGRNGDAWRRLLTVQNLLVPGQSRMPLASLAAIVESAGLATRESRLLAHVSANLPHYAAAIIAAGDPAVRHLALSRVRDAAGHAVSDIIENQVAGAQGTHLAFPLLSADLAPPAVVRALGQYAARGVSRVPEEVTVTLPLPGVWLSAQAGEAIEGLAESARPERRRFQA